MFIHTQALNVGKSQPLPRLISPNLINLNRTRAAVIGISETWLDDSITDAEITTSGYSVLRLDRNRDGGIVCVYIRNGFAFNHRQDLHDDRIEKIWSDILLPKSKPITMKTLISGVTLKVVSQI